MVNTFLPYPDFEASAQILDYRRLGKHLVEAKQILDAMYDSSRGYYNHAATRMWRGYEEALKVYFNAISREWVRRGYVHNLGFYEAE